MTPEPKYRMAVVDDHPLVRQGIVENLHDDPDFCVVAEGACAADAIQIAHSTPLDLIFLDVNMPGGGVDAAIRIGAEHPALIIAMFSFRQDLDIVRACMMAGAKGYIVKGISGPEFNAATRRMLAGETVLDAEVGTRLGLEESVHAGVSE